MSDCSRHPEYTYTDLTSTDLFPLQEYIGTGNALLHSQSYAKHPHSFDRKL